MEKVFNQLQNIHVRKEFINKIEKECKIINNYKGIKKTNVFCVCNKCGNFKWHQCRWTALKRGIVKEGDELSKMYCQCYYDPIIKDIFWG